MDQVSTGKIIKQFRTDSGLTQKQLAERINVSDKTVSKWEAGRGCPDISLIPELAAVFGTDIGVLLSGRIEKNESEKGNMNKIRFFICSECGNIITASSDASVTCCGRKLSARIPCKADDTEQLSVRDIGGEWLISSDHPMTKEHYISFAAYLSDSSMMMFRQYPEWDLNIELPMYRSGRLVWYCSKCGLLCRDMPAE